jgi:hypothetical protein
VHVALSGGASDEGSPALLAKSGGGRGIVLFMNDDEAMSLALPIFLGTKEW